MWWAFHPPGNAKQWKDQSISINAFLGNKWFYRGDREKVNKHFYIKQYNDSLCRNIGVGFDLELFYILLNYVAGCVASPCLPPCVNTKVINFAYSSQTVFSSDFRNADRKQKSLIPECFKNCPHIWAKSANNRVFLSKRFNLQTIRRAWRDSRTVAGGGSSAVLFPWNLFVVKP